ncbi:DUF3124 domain-containing protein [Neiella marina]|uniref:DUF3124 domain-containing protein n=1 Tax=Neiella holothuriorum TaxID=2870530 RepID=A0ABS7EHY3_9GAMM|nr:DUF3124 domain-containing protein [Neiella holothuriorum]MBW8191958.1 DUF3124 domain-containing protein [Neiella holothuriorum]
MKNQKLLLQLLFSALVFCLIIGGGYLANLLEKIEAIDDQLRFEMRRDNQLSAELGRLPSGHYQTVVAVYGQYWSSTAPQLLQLLLINADPVQPIIIESIELIDNDGQSVALLVGHDVELAAQASHHTELSIPYMHKAKVSVAFIRWRSNNSVTVPVAHLLSLEHGDNPVDMVSVGTHSVRK